MQSKTSITWCEGGIVCFGDVPWWALFINRKRREKNGLPPGPFCDSTMADSTVLLTADCRLCMYTYILVTSYLVCLMDVRGCLLSVFYRV